MRRNSRSSLANTVTTIFLYLRKIFPLYDHFFQRFYEYLFYCESHSIWEDYKSRLKVRSWHDNSMGTKSICFRTNQLKKAYASLIQSAKIYGYLMKFSRKKHLSEHQPVDSAATVQFFL